MSLKHPDKKTYSPEELLKEIQRLAELLQKEDLTEEEYLKEKEKLMEKLNK